MEAGKYELNTRQQLRTTMYVCFISVEKSEIKMIVQYFKYIQISLYDTYDIYKHLLHIICDMC